MHRHVAVGVVLVVAALLPLMTGQKTADAPKSAGGTETYKVDPVHSSNWFAIKHLNVANFYGRFNEVDGTIVVSESDPAACLFDIQIKADSVDSHNPARDKHLKSADFFDVEKFPQITFKSSAVKKAGEQAYEVKGDLTLHGVTKPLTVKVERTGAGLGMKGEYRAGFETRFDIQRSDFGMTTMLNGLGDEVRLTVSIEAVRQS
jgi:polyisoprenoid-binding protein YceI